MERLILRTPTLNDKSAILEMVQEFEASASAHDGGFWEDGKFDYEQWLNESIKTQTNPQAGWVRAIQYVSFTENGTALGFLSLRLELNDYLLNEGGHIGYSIRPSQRQKGYAKEQLRQGLVKAHEAGISPVLVTCMDTNEASRRTILANGGMLEDVRNNVERYWIK